MSAQALCRDHSSAKGLSFALPLEASFQRPNLFATQCSFTSTSVLSKLQER